MALVKASSITKVAPVSVEDYLTKRISEAAAAGYTSSKTWIKNSSEAEALQLLKDGGYTYIVVMTDPHSKQYEIGW